MKNFTENNYCKCVSALVAIKEIIIPAIISAVMITEAAD